MNDDTEKNHSANPSDAEPLRANGFGGDVLTGKRARKIQAEQYIEKLKVVGDFVGRDKVIYLLEIPYIREFVVAFAASYAEYRTMILSFGILFTALSIIFVRYRERYLLSEMTYVTAGILLFITNLCWKTVIRNFHSRKRPWLPILCALVSTALFVAILLQQVQSAFFPPKIAPEKFGVAIATFGEGADFRLTSRGREISQLIHDALSQRFEKIPDISSNVELRTIGIIENQTQGLNEGTKIGADLVIRGQLLEKDSGTVVTFQILQAPGAIDNPAFPQVLPVTYRAVNGSIDVEDSNSLTVKQVTEQQAVAIASFSLGLFYYTIPDYSLAAKQFEETLKHLKAMQKPSDVTDIALVLLYLGRSYIQLGDYEAAAATFDQAITYRDDDSSLYFGQAYIYRVFEQPDKQRFALQKVLALSKEPLSDSTRIPAIFNSGLAYEALEDYKSALQQYETIIQSDPQFYSAYLSAARMQIKLENYDEARRLHQMAQDLIGNDPARQIWLSLDIGRLDEKLEQYEEAIQKYQYAALLNPKLATPYFYLAKLYEKRGDDDAARLAYKKLIEVSFNHAWAHSIFANFLYKIGDYQAAIDEFELSINFPMYDRTLDYAHLGQAYTKIGAEQKAIDTFTKAIELPKGNAVYVYTLFGNALFEFNRHIEGVEYYKKAIELEPEKAIPAKFNLGQWYESQAENDKARELYDSLYQQLRTLSEKERQEKFPEELISELNIRLARLAAK